MNQEGEFPDLISAGAQTLVANAVRLGISWRLHLATVMATSSTDLLEARIDGDTDSISVISMIGAVSVGRRVYVITIPPAGNYAVGLVNALQSGQRIATDIQTTISAGFTTTETQVASVAADLVEGWTYGIWFYTGITSTVAGDNAEVRIREDTTVGTQLQQARKDLLATNITEIIILYAQYTAVATGGKTFVGTAVRQAGTGTLTRNTPATAPAYMFVDFVSD